MINFAESRTQGGFNRMTDWERSNAGTPAFSTGFDEYLDELSKLDKLSTRWDYSFSQDLYNREERLHDEF